MAGEEYAPRPTRSLATEELPGGWRMKVYCMNVECAPEPEHALVRAALDEAASMLPFSAGGAWRGVPARPSRPSSELRARQLVGGRRPAAPLLLLAAQAPPAPQPDGAASVRVRLGARRPAARAAGPNPARPRGQPPADGRLPHRPLRLAAERLTALLTHLPDHARPRGTSVPLVTVKSRPQRHHRSPALPASPVAGYPVEPVDKVGV